MSKIFRNFVRFLHTALKIIGITYYDGTQSVVLKSDSSLLVNRKPLFVPEDIHELQALPCYVLRVSRLGKCIASRFASRYYDAIAPGVDFFSADKLRVAQQNGRPWTEAIAFENSLAVGEMRDTDNLPSDGCEWTVLRDEERVHSLTDAWPEERRQLIDEAIAHVSALLTIRQGDLIYVAHRQTPWQLQAEDIVCCETNGNEQLYCKIK